MPRYKIQPKELMEVKRFCGWFSLLFVSAILIAIAPATAQKGGGGGSSSGFSGNWSGTITTSFGTGAFTMRISQSSATLSGSVHFGAPIFDSTLKLSGRTLSATQFSGTVSNGEGSLPITGTLSADSKTMIGTVTQGEVYTYAVTRQ